ncbi:hypothetical protein JAAARDRAFT_625409 [Jaapia argillacea MUCL 33604]|uniref:Fungal-type protein kinase domain-containing protein n=1 Tax=Jaapia argillacea MUCL 33604 TaxID=933084 RepID=A0A067Q7U6_9AGAM|nr:hypothetical protein JAAARDRAFT_625409 [Jaapia argillacea MUCL 33604]
MPSVKSPFHDDLKNSQKCCFRKLLEVFLLRCRLPESTQTADMLLKQSLEQVLPICNEDANVRDSLASYCDVPGREDGRYAPFIKTFNSALELMKTLEFPGLRRPSELDIMFHRTDAKDIHNAFEPTRRPDILLVSTLSAHRANEKPIKENDLLFGTKELLRECALNNPSGNFTWNDCLSAQEFSRRIASARPPPPTKYTFDLKEIDPQEMQPLWKRKAAESLGLPNRRLSRPRRVPPSDRCATYGAEMLSRGVYITHAINLVIIDNIAWVLWYDRQGGIQSHGVDFVQNLPYFLVLLAAFQRFQLQDWGVNGDLVSPAFLRHTPGIKGEVPPLPDDTAQFLFKSPSHDVIIDPKRELHWKCTLHGRGTQVLVAHFASVEGLVIPESKELAVKVYWSEEAKENEIRDDLSIDSKGSRELRVMLFEKLNPIHKHSSEEFMKVWIQCYRCHFRLWLHGIEHGDISVSNLMVRPSTGEGVVNDFDLAILRKRNGEPTIGGHVRPGMIRFMALDLLDEKYFAGKVQRLFHHNCESFVWIMPWRLLRNSRLRIFETQGTSDYVYDNSRAERYGFLYDVYELKALPANKAAWEAAVELFWWVKGKHNAALEWEGAINKLRYKLRKDKSKSEAEVDEVTNAVPKTIWQDPSDEATCKIFREFELILQEGWAGFEVLPEDKTRPLSAEE